MTPLTGGRRTGRARARSESGAILIFVAISLLVIFALTSFVVDYGIIWLSRRQAQNAADAGALAGAVARAYDDGGTPPSSGGPAHTAATATATVNEVWNAAPGVSVSWDCPGFVTLGRCVRVDVYRDGSNGSAALPAYFATLLGRTEQGVRATATAQAIPANASDCLRPWAVPDEWIESRGPADEFNRYYETGSQRGNLLPAPRDAYSYPGYDASVDLGDELTLKFGGVDDPIKKGWFMAIQVPRADGTSGANRYRQNIASCNGVPVRIPGYLDLETGNMSGPTAQGFQDLYDSDPLATFDTATNTVQNSCAQATPPCALYSPRIVAIAVFDPDDYQRRRAINDRTPCDGGGQCVRIVGIFGFFVDHIEPDGDVVGRLVMSEGEYIEGGWEITPGVSFLWDVRLVR